MIGAKYTKTMYQVDPTRRLVTATIGLVLAGILLYLMGLIMSVPALSIHASLLFGTMDPTSVVGVDPATAQGLFFLASILIVAGASLDVWRRLHIVFPHGYGGPFDPMLGDGHDKVLDEPHIF